LISFMLAAVISRWGLCNGICLIFIVPVIWSFGMQRYQANVALDRIFESNIELPVLLSSAALVIWFFARRPTIEFVGNDGSQVFASAPAFPTGAEPIGLSLGVFGIITLLQTFLGGDFPLQGLLQLEGGKYLLSAVTMLVFCFLTYHLFSSRRRLISNLPTGAVHENSELPLRTRLVATALAFAIIDVTFGIGESHFNFRFTAGLGLLGIVLITAIGFDVVSEIRFRLKYRDEVASIMEMDNVYGATYLSAVLAKAGIDSMTRAFHYRSLFFFLEPIVKMELLVPNDRASQAQDLIQALPLQVV
jgi:hypothetical protein